MIPLAKSYGDRLAVALESGTRLSTLESNYKITFETLVQEFNRMMAFLQKYQSTVDGLTQTESVLRNSIRSLPKNKMLQDKLDSLGISLDILDKFVQDFAQLAALGFSIQSASAIYNELRKIGQDPDKAARKIAEILQRYNSLRSAVASLGNNIAEDAVRSRELASTLPDTESSTRQ